MNTTVQCRMLAGWWLMWLQDWLSWKQDIIYPDHIHSYQVYEVYQRRYYGLAKVILLTLINWLMLIVDCDILIYTNNYYYLSWCRHTPGSQVRPTSWQTTENVWKIWNQLVSKFPTQVYRTTCGDVIEIWKPYTLIR